MTLAEMQSQFLTSVLGDAPSPEFLRRLRPPARAESIDDVFAVYHDGYRQRMAEFLSNDYPVLHGALGDEDFAVLVEAYMRARPSRWRNARWVGAGLPAFLRATPPFAEDSLICGLAALEAALTKAFDAADATALPVEFLGVTPQEDWPRLRFGFHPSAQMLDLPPAALACYEAAQREEPFDPDEAGEGGVALLVWRAALEVNYRALDGLEALALREALGGAPFGEICFMLAFARPDEPADELTMMVAGFLTNWFSGGLIVAAAPQAV
jgi:hypothetical protein